ncbi:MAG: hypothetical protein V4616_01905 [Bacteroidota bacterium]
MNEHTETPHPFWKRPSNWALALFVIASFWSLTNQRLWKDKGVIQSDVIFYYEIVPATILHGDPFFTFIDSIPEKDRQYWLLRDSVTHRGFSKTTIGLAITYTPVFIITWAATEILGIPNGDFDPCFHFSVAFSTVLFAWIGLWFFRRVIRRFCSEIATTILVLLAGFATGYWHYTVMSPGYGHVFSAALIAAYVWYNIRYKEQGVTRYLLQMCFLLGLITLIRPSNLLIVLWTLLYTPDKVNLVTVFRYWWKRILPLSVGLVMFMLPILPQLLVWKGVSGNWLMYSYGDEKFFFDNPHLLSGLFGFRNGFFVYSPILLLCFPGFVLLWKKDKNLFIATIAFMFINSYVIYSWWCWWYGGSFGSRPQLDTLIITLIPVALAVEWSLKRVLFKIAMITALVLFSVLSLFQSYQSKKGVIHWDAMTSDEYWGVFGKMNLPFDAGYRIKEPDYIGAQRGNEYPIIVDHKMIENEFELETDKEFPITFTFRADSLTGVTKLYTLVHFKPEDGFNDRLHMVMTVESAPGVTAVLETHDLYSPYISSGNWYTTKMQIAIPEGLPPTAIIKCFFWNPYKQRLKIKNYTLRNF